MKNLVITSSAAMIMSLSLAGCNTMSNNLNNGMNGVSQFGNATVGTGVKYSAQTIGAGANLVANTGAAVGHGISSVADMGVGVVTSPFNVMKPAYHKPVVYHNGHRYMWKNGSYVLVR